MDTLDDVETDDDVDTELEVETLKEKPTDYHQAILKRSLHKILFSLLPNGNIKREAFEVRKLNLNYDILEYLVEVGVDKLVEVGVETLDDVDADEYVCVKEVNVDTLNKQNERSLTLNMQMPLFILI